MTSSGNRINKNCHSTFVGGRGKGSAGWSALMDWAYRSRIETNRQGSIDVWAASSVFPCQISRVPPCLYSLLMEGWTWRGDWGEESHSLLLYQMRIGTFWIDRMAKRLVPPRPGPRSRPPPCLPLATYRLPQHTRTSTHSFQMESNGVGCGGEGLWWFDDGGQGAFFNPMLPVG